MTPERNLEPHFGRIVSTQGERGITAIDDRDARAADRGSQGFMHHGQQTEIGAAAIRIEPSGRDAARRRMVSAM